MRSILVVDDEKGICNLLQNFLQFESYDVAVAFNGKDALTILKNRKFDTILIDFSMPHMTGLEVCEIIRNELKLDIDIFIITAFATIDFSEDIKKYNIKDIFYKPLNLEDILKKI